MTMEPFPQRINRRFDHTKHEAFIFYLLSTISLTFSRPFCLNHSLTKKVSIPLNSSNDRCHDCFSSTCEMITMAGSNLLDGCHVISKTIELSLSILNANSNIISIEAR